MADSFGPWRSWAAGAMLAALVSCSRPDERIPGIAVSNGWTRAIAPGQSAAAVYLKIANMGEGADHLVQVQTAHGDATLHSTSSTDAVARMRPLKDRLEIGPGSTIELKPGGTHIMVTGLKQPLRPGETIGLTLHFDRSGKRSIAIRVVSAGGDEHFGHGMGM